MHFRYVAYTLEQGIVKGRLEAGTAAEARAEVARQGFRPLKVAAVRGLPSVETVLPSLFRVGTGELVQFCRQASTMLNSGGSLPRTLEMLQGEARNPVLRRTLGAVRATLDEGGSFSSALAKHPRVFTPLVVNLLEVGEHTGRLGPALDHVATMLETEHEAKQKIIRAMMYPMAISGMSLVTLGILVTVALPPMLQMFRQMGAQVPFMTRLAITLVTSVKDHFLAMLLAAAAVAFALWLARRVSRTRYWLDMAQCRAPVAGPFLLSYELSRFSRTMAMLLEAGVSLATAVRLGASGCKNQALRRAFADAEDELMSGRRLADALKRYSILPTMFVELVVIGEESNALRQAMNDAARAYQKQLEQRLSSLLGMLEPVSTLVVGGIVGFIAFSMFVPIYSGLSAIP